MTLSVQDWKDRLSRAEEYLREGGRTDKWQDHREYYHNNYADEEAVTVNLIFSVGRSLVPQLYFKAPSIVVAAEKPQYTNMAPVMESIDKLLLRRMGLKYQLKLAVVDAFLTNLAVFKFGYHSIGTELPQERENNPSDIDAIGQSVLELFGDQELAEEASKEEAEMQKYSYHDWVQPDAPWMLLTQPQDFLVPYGCRNIYEAPWCAFRVIRPLDDIRKDPVYSHTDKLKPNVTPSRFLRLTGSKSARFEEDLVEFFEVWDKRTGEIIVVSQDLDQFMRKDKHNLNIQGLPVEILQYNPVSWDFWGESDVTQIYRQVLELNETRTLEMIHKRTSVTKVGVDQNKVPDTEIEKITRGTKGVFKVNGDPNSAVSSLQHNMSGDLFKVSDVIRQDVGEILGFSRNQSGEFDVSRRTATEATIVQHSIQLRSDERRDQMGDLIGDAFGRKIHPMIFDLWTERRVIEVARVPKQLPEQMKMQDYPSWVQFTGPEIKGDYNLSVIADSVVPMTKMERRMIAKESFGMFKNDLRIDQRKLYEFTLAQYDGVLPDGLLLPEEQYLQAVMQQLQFAAGVQPPAPGGNGGGKTSVPMSKVQK